MPLEDCVCVIEGESVWEMVWDSDGLADELTEPEDELELVPVTVGKGDRVSD